MKLKIYQHLSELSQKLQTASDNLPENYGICWENSFQLTEAIIADIQSITNKICFVTGVRFFIDDSTFKQGASGCIMEVKFDQEDEFTITSECLIDHSRVMLRVKQRPSDRKYEAISELIEAKYGSEYMADLKQFEK